MKTSAAVVVLSILFFSFSTDPTSSGETLEWNEYRPLTWADFRGKRTEDAAGDAGSVVQIKAKPYLVKDEVYFEVAALFVRSKSWTEAQAPDLLAHEQLHFDIAELYARKIRKQVKELQNAGDHELKHYNSAIQHLLAESNEVDIQYDLETLHGAIPSKQKEWSDRVKNELYKLQPYKKSKQVISRSK